MRTLRVLFDEAGFRGRYGGVGQAFAGLIRHFPSSVVPVWGFERTTSEVLQVPPFSIPACPDDYASFLSPGEFKGKWHLWRLAQRLFPRRYPDYSAANDRCMEEHLDRGDFDVLHLTAPHIYGDAWRKVVGRKPIVITVHDLIPELMQKDRRIAAMRREMLEAASHIIAVSENTKRDIVRLYGPSEGKITVIHHGYEKGEGRRTKCEQRTDPYVLFVGRRDGYKNWAWFVESVAPILCEKKLKLVCTGSSFTRGEKRLLCRFGIADRVEQQFFRDDEMPGLFAGAMAFVYPSLYEGFGLPILDAFVNGCPVLLADRSCFPEIGGEGALYFNPSAPEDLREKLRRVCDDASLREDLKARGLSRLHAFSWVEASRQLCEVYHRLATVR